MNKACTVHNKHCHYRITTDYRYVCHPLVAGHGLTSDICSTRQIDTRSLATHNNSAGAAQCQTGFIGIRWAHSVLINQKSTTQSKSHKDAADRPGPPIRPVAEGGIRRATLPEYISIILSIKHLPININSHSSQRGVLLPSQSVCCGSVALWLLLMPAREPVDPSTRYGTRCG